LKNRFNRLTSKEWLPFQKSWFKYDSEEKLFTENIRFFVREEVSNEKLLYHGDHQELISNICLTQDVELITSQEFKDEPLQYAMIDLRKTLSSIKDISEYQHIKDETIKLCAAIFEALAHRRFVTVLIPNVFIEDTYMPLAWDLAWQLSSIYSLKDEKIACTNLAEPNDDHHKFIPNNKTFYCLYFRKDEGSNGTFEEKKHRLFENSPQKTSDFIFKSTIPSWFILKPQPRKKNEILHPAKYPEELVTMFLNEFTTENSHIFDPMSGTGSTQVASLKAGRNAFGTELSPFFAEIALGRCREIVQPTQQDLFQKPINQKFILLNKDAREISKSDFPEIDYLITSPPYWDMLNMKGAENQAKRVEKGLQTNYSDNTEDLGNIADYQQFISDLANVYFNILDIMKSGSYLTIVVKNIKKKGKNYPFAWDLSDILMDKLILLPETFWCQDDINLAPYGYGNTFVSNTFHQYCLNFQKP
jgi:DNA modification methylase